MITICEVAGEKVQIVDGKWRSGNLWLASHLTRIMQNSDEWCGPEKGDPDYAAARFCMEHVGGRIIDYETPPPDGKVY